MRLIFTLSLALNSMCCIAQLEGIKTTYCGEQPFSIKPKPLTRSRPADTSQLRCVLRCQGSYYYNEPLIVVDGILLPDNKWLSSLDPNKIQEINILNTSVASALYGSRAMSGVIIIVTKNRSREFLIKDDFDGRPIPSATILFRSTNGKEKFTAITNDSGIVVTEKLVRGCEYNLEVSKDGYYVGKRTYTINRCWEKDEILLSKIYQPYVLQDFKVFPNPVQRGSIARVELNPGSEEKFVINLLDASGRVIFSSTQNHFKEHDRIQIPIENRLSPGTYYINILGVKGQPVKCEKLLIY